MKHIIIGTAGHIDHGKTTLIKALTGRNTDRWEEEQRRGITIDLGFTWFDLKNGNRAGMIDVPGHEKFINNMVAGVVGMDLVLLVIAADEGIMPQTREHMDILEMLGVQKSILVLNKCDLVDEEWKDKLRESYRNTGYRVLFTSARQGEGLEELCQILTGKTTTVAGPSGVGKSSLINRLQTGVSMETGEISTKIERGKHTTRHSELIYVSEDTYIVDTPGFSSIELYGMEKEELQDYFPDFADWEPECRFAGCAHVKERDCGVKTALERGEISRSRYENYCQLYEELKNKRKY